MAKKKKIDYDKYAAGLFARTEQYADKVRQHYATAVEELLKLTANGDLGSSGAFSFGDNTKLSEKANSILRGLYSAVYNEIKGGVASEWEYANLSCDALIESIFGKGLNEDNHFARWFSRNQQAMDSFFKRKSAYGGLNLSQNVWKYVGNLKTEMEVALTVSLGQGDSAATVSRKVRKYLQEPDMMFRRFRVKVGEENVYDEEAGELIGTKPIYGRKWKRKVIDPQTGAVTWENFNPRNYHPGQGVYRSSYKNAMRLTRTETNMAYRSAEQDRWERMDFVVGYRVKRSNNHPAHDICDNLSAANNDDTSTKGVYPKDFVFKGWHPQCRCFVVPILAEQDEFIEMQKAILNGEQPKRSKDMVRKPNDDFYEWWDKNKERVETATSMPYWVQDNQDYINKKKKIRIKTEEEREEIRKRWAERAIKNQKIIKMATNVANVAQNYPEIDLTKLQEYINAKNVSLANTEARTIAKQVSAIKQDEKALSALIPDVHTWKQQFTSAELHQVFDAVETKLNGWASLTLEQQEKKLKFEWDDFLGGNMHNVQSKYKTWEVSQAAYKKKHAEILDAIDWQDIGNVLSEAKTFKTKSKPYLDLISQLESAISAKDKANAQSIVTDMKLKREALKKAAAARAAKRYGKSADGLYVGGNPFTADELAKLKDYETKIIDGIMNGSGADDWLIERYHDYVYSLSEKYYDKQASIFSDTEREALRESTEKYLARPAKNPHYIWGAELGGVYKGHDDKVKAYLPKLKGITKEEISIVQRFTNGSTFSNCYNLRKDSPYWRKRFKEKLDGFTYSEIKEQYETIEEWSQGANYTLDRMVRYNGITFRGLDSGGGPELRKEMMSAFKSGKPWVNNASCSTSMKHSVAEGFDGDTILIIHNKTGAYIHAISDYSSEYEIMTLRGTKYKILVPPKLVGSRYYVELEEMV